MKPGDMRVTPHPSWRWLAERVWSVEHAFERIKAEGRAEEDTRVRIFFVLAAFSFAFLILAFGAGRAALFSGDHHTAMGPVAAAERADLVDRNGLLMAANLTHYKLYIDPDEVWEPAETRRAIQRVLPKVSAERLRKAIEGEKRAFIIGGLTPQQRQQVHDLALPGVQFEDEDGRAYPLGTSAAHLIGFTDAGGRGLSGVERALDADIRQAGHDGRPIALSVDLRVQAALEDELQRVALDQGVKGGVGIVTDIRTGEILGMASFPSFDPGAAGRASDNARLNRATQAVYEMGSTFKVFTLATALDTGTATRTSTFDVSAPLNLGGRLVHDHEAGASRVTLEDIFIHSSNIGTSKLALMMGSGTVVKYFQAFGLFQPGEVELASSWPIRPRRWDQNTLASASFGQAISVSPLALAQAMGAILNGGLMVPLTIRKLEPGQVPEGKRVVSAATSRNMLDLMRLNVVRGTGSKANAAGLRVGGKTGSAQKIVDGHYAATTLVSSFAAVFPTDGPVDRQRYFVLIVLDEPHGSAASGGARTGGWTAAPAVGRVIDRIAPFVNVRRAADPFSTATGEKPAAVEETPDALGEAEQ